MFTGRAIYEMAQCNVPTVPAWRGEWSEYLEVHDDQNDRQKYS